MRRETETDQQQNNLTGTGWLVSLWGEESDKKRAKAKQTNGSIGWRKRGDDVNGRGGEGADVNC